MTTPVVIVLNGVIVAVTDDRPRILTVKNPDDSLSVQTADLGDGAALDALPFGPLENLLVQDKMNQYQEVFNTH